MLGLASHIQIADSEESALANLHGELQSAAV
jgi:hypothetical protein